MCAAFVVCHIQRWGIRECSHPGNGSKTLGSGTEFISLLGKLSSFLFELRVQRGSGCVDCCVASVEGGKGSCVDLVQKGRLKSGIQLFRNTYCLSAPACVSELQQQQQNPTCPNDTRFFTLTTAPSPRFIDRMA